MNEQIKQLAEHAWKEVLSETSIDGDTSNVYSPDEVVAFEQKFAELIVQECAELANEETSLPYNSYSEKIRKHFGVGL